MADRAYLADSGATVVHFLAPDRNLYALFASETQAVFQWAAAGAETPYVLREYSTLPASKTAFAVGFKLLQTTKHGLNRTFLATRPGANCHIAGGDDWLFSASRTSLGAVKDTDQHIKPRPAH